MLLFQNGLIIEVFIGIYLKQSSVPVISNSASIGDIRNQIFDGIPSNGRLLLGLLLSGIWILPQNWRRCLSGLLWIGLSSLIKCDSLFVDVELENIVSGFPV